MLLWFLPVAHFCSGLCNSSVMAGIERPLVSLLKKSLRCLLFYCFLCNLFPRETCWTGAALCSATWLSGSLSFVKPTQCEGSNYFYPKKTTNTACVPWLCWCCSEKRFGFVSSQTAAPSCACRYSRLLFWRVSLFSEVLCGVKLLFSKGFLLSARPPSVALLTLSLFQQLIITSLQL